MRAVRVRVHGRVQGVFFRDSCRREAEPARGRRAGWETSRTAAWPGSSRGVRVDDLVAWCRTGPPGARVERVDVKEVEPSGLSGFEVRGW